MTDDGPTTLASGALTLTLAPAQGGSVTRFDYRAPDGSQIPIFRTTVGEPEAIVAYSSFPLVPYVNRVRRGRFAFRGREVKLTPNLRGDPSPLHGQGWLAPWEVIRLEKAGAELRFVHEPGEWPWRYEARQLFTLDERGLDMVLACTNLSDDPMPCGLGHHPYFPCTAQTRIDTVVESAWTVDENVLPVEKVPAQGRYDLRDRLVCGQGLDNGFGGWSGRARIEDPSLPFAIEMSSPTARFFQIYSPSAGGLFVAEPVTHANGALNEPEEAWPALGLGVLEPGESMDLSMRIEVIPAQ
jgi:aldose 1-epimerase